MNVATAFDPAWCGALTLQERLQTLQTTPAAFLEAVDYDTALAAKRMARWQRQRPFDAETTFAERLASDQLSEADFLRLLGEPVTAVAQRLATPPSWIEQLTRATTHRSSPVLQFGTVSDDGSLVRFLHLVEPLLGQGIEKLRAGLWLLVRSSGADRPFDPRSIERILLAMLPDQLLALLHRTLVLELNIARLREQLSGNTPAERFHSFIERLKEPETAAQLLKEYPVLSRQISQAIEQWADFALEFVRRLCHDWKAICKTFNHKNRRDLLVEVKAGGDRHHRGRAVIIATFASGWKVVYKPRSLQVDCHFQAMLQWLNQRKASLPFRRLTILEKQSHGWVEFVKPESCESDAALSRFFQRQGAYLALLYALQATDFHFENLIAAGEHPVLIDLESLFHPRDAQQQERRAEGSASETLAYSVLRVGLLPQRLWNTQESEGLELSGLGGAAGQRSPTPVPTINGTATDEMQIIRDYVQLEGAHNRPTLRGTYVNAADYITDIVMGFEDLYHLLIQHREAFLAPDGPLSAFAQDEVRVIARPTRLYGLLLQESTHPDFLRNALDRDRFFDQLWLEAVHRPMLKRLIASERNDLWRGDIPMFTTRPMTRHLWDSDGHCIKEVFTTSGLEATQAHIRQLNEEDRTRQIWFIRASLATVATGTSHGQWHRYTPAPAAAPVSRDDYLSAAQAIGDHLAQLGLWGEQGKDITWIGLSLAFNRDWMLIPMGPDLYNGMAGMALFYGYLGAHCQTPRYTEIARAALTTMHDQITTAAAERLTIGGFSELGGALYALTHLGVLWQDETLLDQAVEIATRIAPALPQDTQLDIVGGAAGALLALLGLYMYRPLPIIYEAAVQCGEHLVSTATPMAVGLGWTTPATEGHALCGFSHGNAGIATALLALTEITGNERYRTVAREALAYERSQFVPELSNWRDLRHNDAGENSAEMMAWCHGAPGVGLGRLRSLSFYEDSEMGQEIETAFHSTLTHGFGSNHSLCHGDLGNLDFLFQAARHFGNDNWQQAAEAQASTIFKSIQENGWLCGVPLAVETPGLMTGVAGIGYQLLRLAAPQQVPSVLTLEAPYPHRKAE